ncbi:UNVERIFIED_CONTAM: hypothetical protein PYX00_003022 [Menopon gallinae]|uniref:Uncharacterized protein n=1 Tax=Menopon gallinae TaxID=328185 RepID=A0AAW2HZ10_9NEOP
MHPFNRLTHCTSPYKTCSSRRKDRSNGKNTDRQSDIDEDDCGQHDVQRVSCNNGKAPRSSEQSIPVINVSSENECKSPRKSNDILKAKEKALLSNSSIRWTDNSERLGPNKNNIIKESLKSSQ